MTTSATALPLAVIGGSAGSIDVLATLVAMLPARARAAVVIVVHVLPGRPSHLAEVLAQTATWPVRELEDKEPLVAGQVLVAPPGYHTLVERDGLLSLSLDAPVHYSRPSIDVLFQSAAVAGGEGVLGILLSGANADGAAGLAAIGLAGGVTAVQDPDTAQSPVMPQAGLALAPESKKLTPRALGVLLARHTES